MLSPSNPRAFAGSVFFYNLNRMVVFFIVSKLFSSFYSSIAEHLMKLYARHLQIILIVRSIYSIISKHLPLVNILHLIQNSFIYYIQ